MNTTSYSPLVDKLLTYAPCDDIDIASHEQWPDYLELGFGSEHIPDLIRLATDTAFGSSDSEDSAYCAPVHAWRILGLLHAEAAIEPLITMTEDPDYGDIASDELPEIFGLIGPAAIPDLAAFLTDNAHKAPAHIDAISCIAKIAEMHPHTKEECVNIITHQLEQFTENDPEVNAFLILHLTELKVSEALPLIKQAFDADSVDEFLINWDFVQEKFGLKERAEVPQRGLHFGSALNQGSYPAPERDVSPSSTVSSKLHRSQGAVQKKDKNKNKMAKQSRKKNKRRR